MIQESCRAQRLHHWARWFAIAFCAGWNAGSSHAQPAIDPTSEQIRQQERQREQRSRQEPVVDIHLAGKSPANPQRLPLNESPCFKIELIAIDLAPSADPEKFLWLPEALSGPNDDTPIGKCLGSQGIAMVVKRAQQALSAQGFATSRVFARPQDLSGGTLILSVVPGRVRAIRSGAILNLNDIEQTLENLRRVPTVQADISIEPADVPDQSDLVITHSQAFPVRLAATLDDSGTKATGRYLGSATLSVDTPLSLSDLFYIAVNNDFSGGARGMRGHVVHYSLPLGYWTLGATASANRYYQSVAGINQTYIHRGTTENAELSLARIVQRSNAGKPPLKLKAFQRRSNNFVDDTEVVVQRRVAGGWELSIGHIGDAKVEGSLSLKRGTADFDILPAPEEDFGDSTARFGLILLDATLNLPFKVGAQTLRYKGVLRIQNNTTSLTPQDRFASSSRYTVRGFDGESILSAKRGWLVRNELLAGKAWPA